VFVKIPPSMELLVIKLVLQEKKLKSKLHRMDVPALEPKMELNSKIIPAMLALLDIIQQNHAIQNAQPPKKRDVAGAKCVDCAANEEQDPSDPTKCACKAALKFKSGCTGNCSAGYYPKDTCDKKCAANTYSDGTKAACDACDGAKGKISAEGASECTCTASDANLKDKATDCTCKDKQYGDGDAFKQKCDKTCGANNVYAVSAGLATCKACTEGAAYGAKAD